MSSYDRTESTPDKEWFRELIPVFDNIELCSIALLKAAKRDDWDGFSKALTEREKHLQKIRKYLENFDVEGYFQQIKMDEKLRDLRDRVHKQLKKVTKVNTEIYDIINRKKDEVLSHIISGNKSLRFLNSYKTSVNRHKIISKIY